MKTPEPLAASSHNPEPVAEYSGTVSESLPT